MSFTLHCRRCWRRQKWCRTVTWCSCKWYHCQHMPGNVFLPCLYWFRFFPPHYTILRWRHMIMITSVSETGKTATQCSCYSQLLRLDVLWQPAELYQKVIDVTLDSLVAEAVDQMLVIRKKKQIVIDESMRDGMEQQHSLDTAHTPLCTLLAPLSASTPADVCLSFVYMCGVLIENNIAACGLRGCKNRAHSVSCSKVYQTTVWLVLLARAVFFCFYFVFRLYVEFCLLVSLISTSAIDCLERFISTMTCYVWSGTLNTTHSLTHWNWHQLLSVMFIVKYLEWLLWLTVIYPYYDNCDYWL